MSHPYNTNCECRRCVKEGARRDAQRANAPRNIARKPSRKPHREKVASREEQHARLIDCGWQNWDDRGES